MPSPLSLTVNCPLCGSDQSAPFDQRQFRGQAITNRICRKCGLVYQSPRMSEETLQSYYEHEYRLAYQGDEGPTSKDLAMQRGRATSLLSFMLKHSPSSELARHLDIGCSAGLLLQRFQDKFKCQSVGIEPGQAYREYAQKAGLDVHASLDELMTVKVKTAKYSSPFELISMAHVLEHLPDPVTYLNSLREQWLSSTNGFLLIEVPNLYAHECFEVAHLVSYSQHTLTQTLQKAGYELLALEAHGRPRSQIIPLYLTALAIPLSPIPYSLESYQVIPEAHVSMKRRLGMLRRRILTRLFPAKAWLPAK
jgi:2-polyprenyl-3-methyl-5-hydroxy-6-metoxy-1,4-benzoquinol methylase